MEDPTARMNKGQKAWAFTHQTLAEFHGHIRNARYQMEVASAGLHPVIRAPLLALGDTVYWALLLIAGLTMLAIFCLVLAVVSVVLLGPCTFIFITIINYVPSDESSHNVNIAGLMIALSTLVIPFLVSGTASLIHYKYPEWEDVNLTARFYDPLPLAGQMLVSYALLELGLVCLVLLTFDFCFFMYWGGYGVSASMKTSFWVLSHMPWYSVLLLTIFVSLLVFILIRKAKQFFTMEEDDQTEEFWLGSEEHNRQALQEEGMIRNTFR